MVRLAGSDQALEAGTGEYPLRRIANAPNYLPSRNTASLLEAADQSRAAAILGRRACRSPRGWLIH